MNPVIDQLLSRRSIRQFTGESVKDEDLTLILKAAQQAPTSINGEQVSLIVTRDKATIKKIAEIAGNQPQVAHADVFITFVIDFNRTAIAAKIAGHHQLIEQSAEGIMMGTFDAGIMLSTLQTAAESLGYGTTAIGGIRNDPAAMIKLLNLPPKTFPINGTTIGVPDKQHASDIKPRVPLHSFAMCEQYDNDAVTAGIKTYNQTLRDWLDTHHMADHASYCQRVGETYSKIYFRKVAEQLENQGFRFQDEVKK